METILGRKFVVNFAMVNFAMVNFAMVKQFFGVRAGRAK